MLQIFFLYQGMILQKQRNITIAAEVLLSERIRLGWVCDTFVHGGDFLLIQSEPLLSQVSDDHLITVAEIAHEVFGFTDDLGPNNLVNLCELIREFAVKVDDINFFLGQHFGLLQDDLVLLLDPSVVFFARRIPAQFLIHVINEVHIREGRFICFNTP